MIYDCRRISDSDSTLRLSPKIEAITKTIVDFRIIVKPENKFTVLSIVGAGLPSPYELPCVQIIMEFTIRGYSV